MELHKKYSPWIFVTLNNDEFSHIRAWIHRYPRTQSSDKDLTIKCELMVENAFKIHGLKYFSKNSEKVVMEEMILSLTPDGMFIPEEFFINPPDRFKRVERPDQHSTDEA